MINENQSDIEETLVYTVATSAQIDAPKEEDDPST